VTSRMETNVQQHRHTRLPEVAQESKRQMREPALSAGVSLSIDADIADIEVNASVVELCLTNYLSNAIKYADPRKGERFAVVSAILEKNAVGDMEVVIRVRDNGLGVPAEKRGRLFEEFFRAHESIADAKGTGLGLSIVREAAGSQGGRAWAEHLANGSVFAVSLPISGTSATR